ncbi:25593_t:CDS:2, partial [Dentiscutata erythropus]
MISKQSLEKTPNKQLDNSFVTRQNEVLNDLDIYPFLIIHTEKSRKLGLHYEALNNLNRLLDIYSNNRVVLGFQREVLIDISTKLLKMNPNNEEILRFRAKAYTAI